MIGRRGLVRLTGLSLIGPAGVLASLGVSAQPQGQPRRPGPALVAFLALGAPDSGGIAVIDVVKARLRELGWVEGQTIRYEVRWAHLRLERLPVAASEILALKPDVIWTFNTTTAVAARAATATVPIVFAYSGDPVAIGLAASLARPGGNATGLSNQVLDYASKWLQVLQELLPGLKRVAFLANFEDPIARLTLERLRLAAEGVKLLVIPAAVRSEGGVDAAFASMLRERADAVIVSGDLLIQLHLGQINDLVVRHRVPALLLSRAWLGKGALVSYGPRVGEAFVRRSADYVDRILRGARPGDLPIEQPTRFELTIDLRVVRSLGLSVPRSLLLRADEVIE